MDEGQVRRGPGGSPLCRAAPFVCQYRGGSEATWGPRAATGKHVSVLGQVRVLGMWQLNVSSANMGGKELPRTCQVVGKTGSRDGC